jgi:Ankyrin repeats (3 copies)
MTKSPVEQFHAAVCEGDVEHVRALLASQPEVRAVVNEPIADFGSRPAQIAKKNLPLLDELLAHGADLNLKSAWWAGGFGLLETDCSPAEAAALIERGAIVDIFGAAHLGMFDRVRALVDDDPSLVHARGGDGKTALHCAATVEIARYLLDHGAEIDARDVDHESTAAQYLVRDAPDVTRFLIGRGASVDIFMAVGLRDPALVDRCLRDDPEALDHRTWHAKYSVAHNGSRPATREEVGDRRGDVYRWVFGHNLSAIDAATQLRYDEIAALLLARASPVQRLLAACVRADRSEAEAILSTHPDLIGGFTTDQKRLIADRAHANDTASVALMLDLGFDPHVPGVDDAEAIRWAVFQGNAEMTRRLLAHDPPIGVRDRRYNGTLLGWCIYGAVHGWRRTTGDFATTARLLLDAGEQVDPSTVPTGRADLDALLRRG